MKKKGLLGLVAMLILVTGCSSNIKDGVSYLEEGKYEEAIVAFEAELAEEKNQGEAHHGLVLANYEVGDFVEALEHLEAALAQGVEETVALHHIAATCYMQNGEYEIAIMHYDKALEMEDCTDAERKEMMFNRIVAYEKNGDWEGAKSAADKYLNLYPDDEQVKKEMEFLETR